MISSSPRAEGFRLRGDLDHRVVVEIQPGDRVVRLRLPRLLLDAEHARRRVELDDAVALRVLDVVAEDVAPASRAAAAWSMSRQAFAVEDVVAQNQADGVAADELARR